MGLVLMMWKGETRNPGSWGCLQVVDGMGMGWLVMMAWVGEGRKYIVVCEGVVEVTLLWVEVKDEAVRRGVTEAALFRAETHHLAVMVMLQTATTIAPVHRRMYLL